MFRRLSSINIYCHPKKMFENAKDLIDQLDESHLEAATHNNKFYVQKETKYELLPETQRKFVPYNGTRDPGRIA